MIAAQAVRILHASVPGRARYAVRALERNNQLAHGVEQALRATPGVHAVHANPLTGTVLLRFAASVPRDVLDNALVAALRDVVPQAAVADTPAATAWIHTQVTASARAFVRSLSSWRVHGQPTQRARSTAATRKVNPALAAEDKQTPSWHVLGVAQVCEALHIPDANGHSDSSAEQRLNAEGPNALTPPPQRSEFAIFLAQLSSTPVLMLAGSAVLSVATGGVGDALAILAVLGINATLGYVTESGAERSIASLSRAPSPCAPVLRAGRTQPVPTERVVRGDVLVLSAGVFVAADARVIRAEELTVDESSLTGESVPVQKHSAAIQDPEAPLGERLSMVYRGTLITGGSGLALVVGTGDRSEIGRIQTLASSVQSNPTPMQRQLDRLGTQLAWGAGAACAATLGVGLLRGGALLPMFRTAVSLAVAAVPEGLPTVAITTLALGLSRMRDQHVLVRQLAAVETLGSVQVICVDKTGTLTVNRMSVTALQAGLTFYAQTGGTFVAADGGHSLPTGPDLDWLLRVAVLCNEVELVVEQGSLLLRGSATESALVQLALDAGCDVRALRAEHPCVRMKRRSEAHSYMASVHQTEATWLLAIKGRPSEVLAMCRSYMRDGERHALGDAERSRIENDNERMAGRALRVLGFAFSDQSTSCDSPQDLVWAGLVGMQDPPREGVALVIKRFRQAGIRTIMITGDQTGTAEAVGKQVALSDNDHLEIVDSTRLDRIEPAVLSALAQRAHVFARVSPAHKLQIVDALQHSGLVVAMTGDGVNDSPALKAADIGIAMGAGGSSVAREVADVVLEDDELMTLVSAVEQGRAIYADIRKAVHFILSTNLTEILYTFTCVASGMGEPLTPLQLLWINLITDIFPELALAVQPPESDVMHCPPRDPARPMFTGDDLARIGGEGTVMTLGALGAYFWARSRGGAGARPSTVGFMTLTLTQLLHGYSARSETHTIFDRGGVPYNRWLHIAVGGTMATQVLANLVPPLRRLLGTVALSPADWLVVLAGATGPFLINELTKLALRPDPNGPRVSVAPARLPGGAK
jgi:Ca2+-transporting ATPase